MHHAAAMARSKNVLRALNRPKGKTSPKDSSDLNWLDACTRLEETLKGECEDGIETLSPADVGNAAHNGYQNGEPDDAGLQAAATGTWDRKDRYEVSETSTSAETSCQTQTRCRGNLSSSAVKTSTTFSLRAAGNDAGLELSHANTGLSQAQINDVQGVSTTTDSWKFITLEEALNALEEGASTPPSTATVAYLLARCRRVKNQRHALRLCAYMHQNGLDSDRSLGDHLVYMLVENGCILSAQEAFDRLTHRSQLSWNSLITGYLKSGELNHAIVLYQKMARDTLLVNNGNIVALLKACVKQKDLQTGTELHATAVKLGLLNHDIWIAHAVVDLYSKCGSLAQAFSVFEKLPVRDVISWTSIITGYADHGLAEQALECFQTMQHEGVNPDRVILVCSLRACGSVGAVEKVMEVHIHCERLGLLERDASIGTMLVDIYATCGSLSRAQQVFDRLFKKDVITWTVLIKGYTEHGRSKDALGIFNQMQREGVSPDAVTLICALKASGKLRFVEKVEELHAQVDRSGLLERDDLVGTVLVDTYAKCGLMGKTLEVFNGLKVQDVVSWTALIEGYVEHGHGEDARRCFERMQMECVDPNVITFSCSLKACSSIGAILQGKKIHCQIEERGVLKKNQVVGNALVDFYIKCGFIAEAHRVFDNLPVRDVVSWTLLIAGYAECGHGETALSCFDQMQLEGVSPNAVTFLFSLKACASIGDIDKGEEIHSQIGIEGLSEGDAILGTALIDMYAAFGLFTKAQQVFDKVPNPNVVSWTSLIARFAQHGYTEEALSCFNKMQRSGVSPNDVAFATVLKVCSSIGAIDKVQDLHSEIERRALFECDLVGNVLVFVYSKCGLLALALEIFDRLPSQDVVSWNSLIAGYTQLGDMENALSVFDQMLEQGLKPASITFTNILSACNRQGSLSKSETYFEAMSKDYGIISAPEHLCGMLDIFCRSGHFDKARSIMDAMSNDSNVVMWHSFLGACKNFQNVELGKWAFDHTLHTGDKKVSCNALISHIHGGENTSERGCQFHGEGMERPALLLES